MNSQDNRSIEELTQAIELDPTDVDAYHYRGRAYHKKGNYDKAIADYTKSIKLNPKLADAYNSRGAAHNRKGDYDQAIKDLDKAIQLNPKSAKAYNNRGTAYRWKCDYDKAIANYTESIKLNPKSAKAYNNRGAAHSRKGDYDQAIKDLNKAIQLNPKSAKAYDNRKELQNWIIKMEGLLNQLRNLASQPSIDQSTFDNFEVVYDRLMRMHQTRNLPEQIIQEVNRYHEKMIDRKRFSDLSAKAMNPNVAISFLQPQLDEDDIKLVGKWCQPQQNNLDRTSVMEARGKKKWELGRLLSARSAEKVAADFYRHYGKKVKDISITQIDKNSKSDYWNYDLNVDDIPVDVKNSRKSRKSEDRYTEHCIPRFKYNREKQDVIIAGVFSSYLWPCTLLAPTEYHGDTTSQFLGEITRAKLQELRDEFENLINFGETTSTGIHFLPPWVFDYPKYVYRGRDQALKKLKSFPNLASIKGATFEFNLIPVGIAAGIDLTAILDNGTLDGWEQEFLNQLRDQIEKYGLSLPFLFLTILEHFRSMAASSKTVSNFEPDGYRRFLFYGEFDKPLGIYDPLKTVDSLIKALSTLWTAENGLIRQFRQFKLRSLNILWGKSNRNENRWTTLIAYCGECGKNPLVLGESKICEHRSLICPEPDCGFCCDKCEKKNNAEGLENE